MKELGTGSLYAFGQDDSIRSWLNLSAAAVPNNSKKNREYQGTIKFSVFAAQEEK